MEVVLFDVGLVDSEGTGRSAGTSLWRTQSVPSDVLLLWSDQVEGKLISDGDLLLKGRQDGNIQACYKNTAWQRAGLRRNVVWVQVYQSQLSPTHRGHHMCQKDASLNLLMLLEAHMNQNLKFDINWWAWPEISFSDTLWC